MFMLRNRKDPLFSQLSPELIREISEFGQNPNSDFAKALHYVAFGELKEAKTLIDANPRLVLQSGTVVTRSGLTVRYKTLLECALGEGDHEMAAMIMPYFSQFEGGEKEKARQLERYRPFIEGMQNQEPYNLTWLINIIKESSPEDVTAALNKDMKHESKLRDALIKFRNEVKPGTVKQPQMHYNYQTLIHAFDLYDREWDNLYVSGGNNYDKCDLVWRQVIGYLERGLPAVDRFAFARRLYDLVKNKMPLERKTEYKESLGSYPDTSVADSDFSGLGFDYGIYEGLRCTSARLVGDARGAASSYKTYVEQKTSDLQNLCRAPKTENRLCMIV